MIFDLDFTRTRNTHFMLDIRYDKYSVKQVVSNAPYDLMYRLSFYFVFGK